MVAIAPEKTLATISVYAAAKLNLTLSVLGPREDGFHELDSLVVGVDLCDTLAATKTNDGTISIRCDDSALVSADNLAVRAARLLQDEYAVPHGISFELHKVIPVGGGMGGGSSDAAGALRLCNALWSLGLSDERLARHGAVIGSDVPLFFALPSAVITGRGENVTPVQLSWSGWVVLACVQTIVPTPDVYQAWSQSPAPGDGGRHQNALLAATRASAIMDLTTNDLEPAVFTVAPEVCSAFDAVTALDLGTFRVSGAGATLFRLYDEEKAARCTARTIEEKISSLTTQVVAVPFGACPIRTKE